MTLDQYRTRRDAKACIGAVKCTSACVPGETRCERHAEMHRLSVRTWGKSDKGLAHWRRRNAKRRSK